MILRVDAQSPEPIFEQIAFQVKSAVARGEIEGGHKLPSVRELAKELAINPNTVARAYETLERDGVIVRRQGSGCFVTGETSALRIEERRRRLDQLVQRAVTEAFHLGLDGEDVRAAIERHLKKQTVTGSKR
ncbi:MAG: GntR family transcriptional regulator [Planctomycetota bacterium]